MFQKLSVQRKRCTKQLDASHRINILKADSVRRHIRDDGIKFLDIMVIDD